MAADFRASPACRRVRVLGAIGLVLPLLTGVLYWLTPPPRCLVGSVLAIGPRRPQEPQILPANSSCCCSRLVAWAVSLFSIVPAASVYRLMAGIAMKPPARNRRPRSATSPPKPCATRHPSKSHETNHRSSASVLAKIS
jgi:hypothetical protein